MSKVDLILHPVRLRILQTLTADTLTTQQISDRLPDIPKSSIYRHLKVLLDGEIIAVADTQLVHGIQEKRYTLEQNPRLSQEDLAGLSVEEHLHYFTIYMLSMIRDFGNYLAAADASEKGINMLEDFAGYTDTMIWVTQDELAEFQQAINQTILPLLYNQSGDGRHKHKIAIITHPITNNGE